MNKSGITYASSKAKELLNYLKRIEESRVDAIIVSDPYVMDVALKKTNLENF